MSRAKKDVARKTILTVGPKGRSIRVFIELARDLVRVQWREHGALHTQSYPNTRQGQADAKAWAKGFSETRDLPASTTLARLTQRQLFERFMAAEFNHLRDRTKRHYQTDWRQWELFAGRNLEADLVTAEMLDEYRGALTKRGLSINEQRKRLATIKMVYAWGLRRELLARDRVSLYRFKVAKEARSEPVPEYSGDEYRKLLEQFNPRLASQWRAWSLTVLLGELGPRVNAALHLRWEDIDFTAGDCGAVTWQSRWDKLGNDRTQPLTAAARDALLVALGWSTRDPKQSGWVYYAANELNAGDVYAVQAYTWMLHAGEKRGGVTPRKRRAAHSLRRMSAGNALEHSSNIVDAMHWIGDTDLKQARKYLEKRETRMSDLARSLSGGSKDAGEGGNG